MLEGPELKMEQYRRYLSVALRQTKENIRSLQGQTEMLEDYERWLSNELDNLKIRKPDDLASDQ